MPPNAEDLFNEKIFELQRLDRSDRALEMRRMRAWRLRRTKPRTSIKRITEKTALLWWIHQSSDDEELKRRLRQALENLYAGNATDGYVSGPKGS